MPKEIWREKHSQNKGMFNEADSKKESSHYHLRIKAKSCPEITHRQKCCLDKTKKKALSTEVGQLPCNNQAANKQTKNFYMISS